MSGDTTAENTSTPIGDRWGDPIGETRKQELWAQLRAWWDKQNHDGRSGPFEETFLTGADIFWLAVCALAGHEQVPEHIAESRLRSASTDQYIRFKLDFSLLHLQKVLLLDTHLEGAILPKAHFEGSDLSGAHLDSADLNESHLEKARLWQTHLEKASLWKADLAEADLNEVYMEECSLNEALLGGASLEQSHLRRANLNGARLQDANLIGAQLQDADLSHASLQKADLRDAQLRGAIFFEAQLDQANLRNAQLERAVLRRAVLTGANLREANLAGANLREAFLNEATTLRDATFSAPDVGGPQVADARWGGVNFATLKGTLAPPWGDETVARQWQFQPLNTQDERPAPTRADRRRHRREQEEQRLKLYHAAVRANRQVAVALQNQGMNEEAGQFAYHAQLMQRAVYRYSGWRALGRWLFSWFLWLIAGYGYRPGRSVVVYLSSVAVFAIGYYALGMTIGPHLSPYEAAVVSLTAFHGRGFFATDFRPGDPQAGVAALEAVFGLLIEISFIATFTQRFFGSK